MMRSRSRLFDIDSAFNTSYTISRHCFKLINKYTYTCLMCVIVIFKLVIVFFPIIFSVEIQRVARKQNKTNKMRKDLFHSNFMWHRSSSTNLTWFEFFPDWMRKRLFFWMHSLGISFENGRKFSNEEMIQEPKREKKIAKLIVNAVRTHAHSFSTHLCTLSLMIFTIFTEPTRKNKKKASQSVLLFRTFHRFICT